MAPRITKTDEENQTATAIEAEVVEETPPPSNLDMLKGSFAAMRKTLKAEVSAQLREAQAEIQKSVDDLAATVTELAKEPSPASLADEEDYFGDKLRDFGARLDGLSQLVERITLREPVGPAQGGVNPPAILAAIHAVMQDVTFVPKNGNYDGGKSGTYTFRRFDDTAAAIGNSFRAHGVFVQTETLTRTVNDYDKPYANGGSARWTDVYVQMRYTFTSLVDGTTLTVESYGQGKDNSDKATGKAMTSCLKTALTQAFMIPTNEPDPDDTRPGDDAPPVGHGQGPRAQSAPKATAEERDAAQLKRQLRAVECLNAARRTVHQGSLAGIAHLATQEGLMNIQVEGATIHAWITSIYPTLPPAPASPSAAAQQDDNSMSEPPSDYGY